MSQKKFTVSKDGAYLFVGSYADCIAWIEAEKVRDYKGYTDGWTTNPTPANYFIF